MMGLVQAAQGGPGVAPLPEWVIQPRQPGVWARVKELGSYGPMFKYFASLALKKTYQRTILGNLWVFIRPLFPVLAGTLVFGSFMGVDTGGTPYFLFYLVGMSLWQFFSSAVMWSTRSLELNRRVLKKVYFPRLMLPVAYVLPALTQYIVLSLVVVWSLVYYYFSTGNLFIPLRMNLLFLFIPPLLAGLFAVGIGLWTSVPGSSARDVRFALQYVLNFWYFITPVLYPVEKIPKSWKWLVIFNPMAVLDQMYKNFLLGTTQINLHHVAAALFLIGAVFLSGLLFFSRYEMGALDRI
jgi:lipopolysaccharide transport system permease protein